MSDSEMETYAKKRHASPAVKKSNRMWMWILVVLGVLLLGAFLYMQFGPYKKKPNTTSSIPLENKNIVKPFVLTSNNKPPVPPIVPTKEPVVAKPADPAAPVKEVLPIVPTKEPAAEVAVPTFADFLQSSLDQTVHLQARSRHSRRRRRSSSSSSSSDSEDSSSSSSDSEDSSSSSSSSSDSEDSSSSSDSEDSSSSDSDSDSEDSSSSSSKKSSFTSSLSSSSSRKSSSSSSSSSSDSSSRGNSTFASSSSSSGSSHRGHHHHKAAYNPVWVNKGSGVPTGGDPDYLIVGGGTSGLPAARELLERGYSVHVYNVGGPADHHDVLFPSTPSKFGLFADPNLNLMQVTDADPTAFQRKEILSTARNLGGTSLTNYMLLSFGSSDSWDKLSAQVKDTRWGWTSVKPVMQQIRSKPAGGVYRNLTDVRPFTQIFMEASQALKTEQLGFLDNAQIEEDVKSFDYNTSDTPARVVGAPEWFLSSELNVVHQKRMRLSSDRLFLTEGEIVSYDAATGVGTGIGVYANKLKVFPYHVAVRLLFQKQKRKRRDRKPLRVKSVLFRVPSAAASSASSSSSSSSLSASSAPDVLVTRSARKKIILACGAIQTPVLLQRSGYGPRQVLKSLATQSKDFRAFCVNEHVGAHLDNHSGPAMTFRIVGVDGADPLVVADQKQALLTNLYDDDALGSLALAWMGWHAADPSRPAPSATKESLVKYQLIMMAGGSGGGSVLQDDTGATADDLSVFVWDVARFGKGRVAAAQFQGDANSENAGVDMEWDLYRDRRDLYSALLAYDVMYRYMDKINVRLDASSAYNFLRVQPLLPKTLENFRTLMNTKQVSLPFVWRTPVAELASVDVLKQFSDYVAAHPSNWYVEENMDNHTYDASRAVRVFAQRYAHPASHPSGTCRMGASSNDSVVDSTLHVHHVENLMIADMSVVGVVSSGNTAMQAMVIGVKAGREFA